MSDNELLSLEQALKELQIDRNELTELFRKNVLRYILDDGKIKIPKMALMALKLERMTSNTQQFAKVKRSQRKRSTSLTISPKQNSLTYEETAKMLEISEEELQQFIDNQQLRVINLAGNQKIPQISAQALKIQLSSFNISAKKKLQKNKPRIRRVY